MMQEKLYLTSVSVLGFEKKLLMFPETMRENRVGQLFLFITITIFSLHQIKKNV
jgi:hypothetical protein